MSKNKKIILIVAVLSCILLSFIGGQSYSKYVAQLRGDGTADIATWSFKVNGNTEQVQTIELKSTYDNATLVGNKIAPGTEGSFNIIVDGTGSDVGINYSIRIDNKTEKPENLKFIYDDQEYYDLEELNTMITGTINANEEDKTRTIAIGWRWDYETGTESNQIYANDLKDTQNAQNMANYQFDVTVSGAQVVPE